MPLMKGAKAKTKKGMEHNLKTELASGKKKSQALAIMYSEAGESKPKTSKSKVKKK